jgi:calcineurin-like phosphoesterase family protein
MSAVWLTSDTHFGHLGVCRFTREDGSKLRPWDTPEAMDEDMVERWNDTVRPKDKVYHLGDVVINRRALSILDRLHGDKVLIKGNHDIFKLEDYTKYFRDIRAYHVMTGAGVILSHIPLHPDSHGRFGLNIHGHTHEKRVKTFVPYCWKKC